MQKIVLLVALGIFGIYCLNLVLGATGVGVFLSDVVEMVLLFIACLFLVIIFLMAESKNTRTKRNDYKSQEES